MSKAETGVVTIGRKEYQTVALRVSKFRADHPDWPMITEILERSDECIVMRTTIANSDGVILATGHSEEYRRASQINKTSALENAETSAIGRALANLGYGGTEFATANEVQNAIHQQANQTDDVQQEPPPRANWGGRYPNKTKLREARTVHHAELERMAKESTFDDLDVYLTSPEYADYIATASEHFPYWLEGEIPPALVEQMPPEYVQTFALEAKARDMIAIRGNVAAGQE